MYLRFAGTLHFKSIKEIWEMETWEGDYNFGLFAFSFLISWGLKLQIWDAVSL